MDSKKIAIWVLSIVLAGALTFLVILFLQNRKMKARLNDPSEAVQNYIKTLPIYQSDSEARANGLVTGDHYRKSATATDYDVVAAATA